MRARLACGAAALAFAGASAYAYNIVDASYDEAADELVVEIVYRGTNPDHDFSLEWGSCSEGPPHRVVARLVDDQWQDVADRDYRVRERFALKGLQCRPAQVTLRAGPVQHAGVFVPSDPRSR